MITRFGKVCAGPRFTQWVARPLGSIIEASVRPLSSKATGPVVVDWDSIRDIPLERIRTFSIIAHVDHGKSTLADRLLEMSGNVVLTEGCERQLLDDLKVERERGITVKARTASMVYKNHLLNLIDTPGHTDFEYEVKRSLTTCQGALLLVDSSQGIQAQTLANYESAVKAGLKIIPVLTKLDLPHSDPAGCLESLERLLGIPEEDVIWTSAKSGEGCEDILPRIIKEVPPPKLAHEKDPSFPEHAKFRGMVVDSWYDKYRGTVCLVSVDHGVLEVDDSFYTESMIVNHGQGASTKKFTVTDVGILVPQPLKQSGLKAGQVGYLVGGIRESTEVGIGDYISDLQEVVSLSERELKRREALTTPKVFASIYPIEAIDYDELRKSLQRLLLNDSSVTIKPEASNALGQGFRCGFLGKLHMEVFFQRLEDEFATDVIATAPTVSYWAVKTDGQKVLVDNPAQLPPLEEVDYYMEPMARVSVMTPSDYIGPLMTVFQERRGKSEEITHIDENKVLITYILPWQEVLIDLHETVKTVTSGFANFEYKEIDPVRANVVKVDILLNGKPVDALSFVVDKDTADSRGREVAKKLKKIIKRQQFEVHIQAAIGAKILASERIPPYRKDVLTKSGKTVGGGDQTRKRKLLEKQKRGKKKMKQIGNVEIEQKALLSILER